MGEVLQFFVCHGMGFEKHKGDDTGLGEQIFVGIFLRCMYMHFEE